MPSGMAGVRVSEFSGTRPGVLYPGLHLVTPLVDSVAMLTFAIRSTPPLPASRPRKKKVARRPSPKC